MQSKNLYLWKHGHSFGQEKKQPGETRTIIVIGITLVMMVVEIAAGFLFGSMALLADGLHMASHSAALGISAVAYIYARRHALDDRFSFGTGKVNALGGFTGAVLLAVFALLMVGQSVERLIHPVAISFDQAIVVAVVGLIVNGLCAVILSVHHDHHHDHEHSHEHGGAGDEHDHAAAGQLVGERGEHHDHNLRAAYLHVLADALTSVLAIGALLAGKWAGMAWMDPVMGMVGAMLVAQWSTGLLRSTSAVLLDRQGPGWIVEAARRQIEIDGRSRIADVHLWSIGPRLYAMELVIVADQPQSPDAYKARLPHGLGLAHVTVEVHQGSSAS